jgi:hypothetical protein
MYKAEYVCGLRTESAYLLISPTNGIMLVDWVRIEGIVLTLQLDL